MDSFFVPLVLALGASLDQIKLLTCLLASYLFASLYTYIPASQASTKHIFHIAVTLLYLVPVLHLNRGLAELLVSSLGTYVLAASIKGRSMPWIVFALVMGHLVLNQFIRSLNNTSYETVDITGAQMVLTMKLTTFAWNVWDGRRALQDLDKWQMERRVTEMPSILEFLGYVFYFPGFLVGPYLDFASYRSFVDETVFSSPDKGDRIPPGRKRAAYSKLITGLVFLGLFVILGPKFNYTVALELWFKEKPYLYRFVYFQLCGFFERTKYYAIWTLTEGASILTGFGFAGYTHSGVPIWNGAANVKKREIEFPSNFKVLLDSWNMKTNVWLRECVYKRVTPKGKKPGFRSSMLTFLTSALWHGIAPGYYLTFLLGGFFTPVGRLARASIRPLLLPAPGQPPSMAKRLYDISGGFLTLIVMNFMTVPFMLLTLRDTMEAWNTLGWYGLYIVFGGLAFFYAGGERWLKGIQKKREKKATLYSEAKKEKTNGAAHNGYSTAVSTPPAVSTPNAGPGEYPPALIPSLK